MTYSNIDKLTGKIVDVLYGRRTGMCTLTTSRMKSFADLGDNLSSKDILGCEEIIFKLLANGEISYVSFSHDYYCAPPSGCYISFISDHISEILYSEINFCSEKTSIVLESDEGNKFGEDYEVHKYVLDTSLGRFVIVFNSHNINGFFPKSIVNCYSALEFKNINVSLMGKNDKEYFVRHV